MSENLSGANKTKRDNDDQGLAKSELQKPPLTADKDLENVIYDKQQLLVEKASNTFRELCQTLENEQTKLVELEERRKILQEEMLLLKAEIEEEKQSFNLKIAQSVSENLSILNNTSIDKVCVQNQFFDDTLQIKNSYACNEEEEPQPVTARNLSAEDSQELNRD